MLEITNGPQVYHNCDISEALKIDNFSELLDYFKQNILISFRVKDFYTSTFAMHDRYPELSYTVLKYYKTEFLDVLLNKDTFDNINSLFGYRFIGTYNQLYDFFNSYKTPLAYVNELKKTSPGIYSSLCGDLEFEMQPEEENVGKNIANQLSDWLQKLYTGE